MKKTTFLFTTAIASILLFAACKNNTVSAPNNNTTDTTGFAQFSEWKAMQDEQQATAALAATQKATATKASSTKTMRMSSSTTNEAKVAKKKGWSKAAKYTVAGTAGGAVLGAVINKKNPVKGAIVGGVLLGGGGYVLGRSQDKKDGRIQ